MNKEFLTFEARDSFLKGKLKRNDAKSLINFVINFLC